MDKQIAFLKHPGTDAPVSPPRSCRWFLDGYSDYRDSRLNMATRAAVAAHLGVCASCRRYDRVIRRGVEILRDTPPEASGRPLEVASLRERALAVERQSMALGTAGSGVSVAAAIVVALLLGVAAWSPLLSGGTPEVEMPPVMADAPPKQGGQVFFTLPAAFSFEFRRPDPVETARSLLFEYGHTPARPSPRGVAGGPDSQ